MRKPSIASLVRITALLFLVFVLLCALATWDANRFLSSPLTASQARIITVPRGTSMQELTDQLLAKGVIQKPRDALYLSWYAQLWGYARTLKAGEYKLNPGMTAPDLLQEIARGEVYQHALTLIDGWTFRQAMTVINTEPALKHLLRGDSPKQIMKAIGHPGVPAEGHFIPNTYYFPRGMTDIAFLERAYRHMQDVLDKEWKNRQKDLPLQSPEQALILASIIEKESSDRKELPRIAGVFIRRLKNHMRLQSDPTVIYGLGKSFKGNLTKPDLHKDTPYNTYTRAGLPPTPISLPDKASLHAALHPAGGKALYFVAKGDGTHAFSATYAEHKRAVRKYQLH